jgi:hypothetical protein
MIIFLMDKTYINFSCKDEHISEHIELFINTSIISECVPMDFSLIMS